MQVVEVGAGVADVTKPPAPVFLEASFQEAPQ